MILPKRVCVTGGRHFNNREVVFSVLDKMFKEYPHIILISGAATGADSLAIDWYNEVKSKPTTAPDKANLYLEKFPANWKKHGKAAGPIRNKEMLDSGIDLLIAFPGGKGTHHMKSICNAAGVRIKNVE